MKEESFKVAVAEAKRFLDKAKKVGTYTYTDYQDKKHTRLSTGQNTAALKRSSMDLTRALAALRKA